MIVLSCTIAIQALPARNTAASGGVVAEGERNCHPRGYKVPEPGEKGVRLLGEHRATPPPRRLTSTKVGIASEGDSKSAC